MISFEINIPDSDVPQFLDLANASSSEIDKIVELTANIPILYSVSAIQDQIKSITPHYKIIFGLYYAFCRFDISENEFIEKLHDFYKAKSESPMPIDEFRSTMIRIFNEKSPIKTSIKSALLKWENAYLFESARIISDIRPVFNNRYEEKVISKLIIHQLRLTYYEQDKTKEIYISLDDKDLLSLKEIVERAIRKNEVLNKVNI